MNPIPRWLAVLILAPAFALHAETTKPTNSRSSDFVFSFFPKSLQKNPAVDFNIISEMTNAGRQAPKASPSAPIYYLAQTSGVVHLGQGGTTQEKVPQFERLQKTLDQSLARAGYLASTPEHNPTVLIIYTYGSHTPPIDSEASADGPADPSAAETAAAGKPSAENHVLINELLDRARLVGGEKFAGDLIRAMNEEGAMKAASHGAALPPPDDPAYATGPTPSMPSAFSPIEKFRKLNSKNMSLLEDSSHGIYFVVASAYDMASVQGKNKTLLWRTKMSVNASGISMTETVPALVVAAAPYFGRDMTEPDIIGQKINREGNVEIGTAKVVGFGDETKPDAPRRETPASKSR